VRWGDPEARDQLCRAAITFLQAAGGRPWQIAWCAGAAVTSSNSDRLTVEEGSFEALLEALAATGVGTRGALFVASSAGGVYGGAAAPPFTERHQVRPLSAYGSSKLALEKAATAWGYSTGVPVLLGRIANLYGPGQDLTKQQGLISHLCRAHLLRQPTSLFVPLDTVRDYLFAGDCAELVADALDRLRSEGGVHIKILASQQAVTVGALVSELRRIFKTAPRIIYGSSPTSHLQARDLRLRSEVWPDLDRRQLTTLPAGINATILALSQRLHAERVAMSR
jgi:UDP-glucose 4-epimerase